MRCPTVEFLLTSLLITTSTSATETDPDTPPDVTRYCITEFGPDSGLEYIHIVDLNQRGQALGWGYLGEGVEVFLWDRKRGYKFIEELAHEQEIPAGPAVGFNDRGQIVGTRSIGPDSAILRASIWNRGKDLRLLEPAPGDDHSVAVDINNRGDVIGTSGPYPSESTAGVRSVIWDRHSRVTVIPDFPDSTGGMPYAVNEAGQVIGASDTPSGVRGYIWDRKGGLRVIEGLIEDSSSVPSAINDHGEVVGGSSFYNGSYGQHAVYWSEASGVVDLGDLPGGPEISHASAINNHHQIVGYATGQGSTEAVIWDSHGRIHKLNEMLIRAKPEDQYLHLGSGRTITDAGWITASGFDTRDHQYRVFLLTPARISSTGIYHCSCAK